MKQTFHPEVRPHVPNFAPEKVVPSVAQGTLDGSVNGVYMAVVGQGCLSCEGSAVGLCAEGCRGAAVPGSAGQPPAQAWDTSGGSKLSSGEQ